MSGREILFSEFPPNTMEEWQAQLEKELKGKNINELAQRSRAEDIYVEPFFFNQAEEKLLAQAHKIQWLLSYRTDNTWEIGDEQKKESCIDTAGFHNKGANATQELSIALSKGLENVSLTFDGGKRLDEVLTALKFNLAIGNDFFIEIAKFRALRLLWANIAQQLGAKQNDSFFIKVNAETSERIYTEVEPYTNLLRATTQAMSAIIGGADRIYIKPFDYKTGKTDFSNRLAENIHHMLQYEGRLEKVLDAGGGSWYLEKLTETLANKAWGLFQQIEEKGGYTTCMASGWINTEIEKTRLIRTEDFERGNEITVGVNKYVQKSEA